jgi:TonB family protein
MNTKQDWFERWPEPRGQADCPPESKLVEWASEPERSEAQSHLAKCSKCAEIVEMVGKSANSPSDSLYAFMSDVRKRAQQEAEQRMPLQRAWFNYAFASPARAVGAVAGVGALILMVTSGVWRHLGIFNPPPQAQVIRMDQDPNEQSFAIAMAQLRQSYANIRGGNIDRDQAAEEVVKIDLAVSSVDKNRLRSEERQQLDTLQAKYHALVLGDLEKNINSHGKEYSAKDENASTKGVQSISEKENTKSYAVGSGGFDMPVGAGGNNSGGSKQRKGTVTSAGFGNSVATSGKIVDFQQGSAPVEITYNTSPVYTDEARSLKVEGEVLLEVTFSTDGTLHVNRVVRGLGHGLDESAIAAASTIRFKPAMRNGQPVDSTAIVHIKFQLAD